MLTVSITRTSRSRATIAAGTRPPRVMATMALNGPAEASRQASARASRWNWSHETGKAFSRGAVAGGFFAQKMAFSLARAVALGEQPPRGINTFPMRAGRVSTGHSVSGELGEHRLDGAPRRADGRFVLPAHHDLIVEAPILE